MTAKLLSLSFVAMIIAAAGCADEVAEKPTQVQAQTQALVMAPGWISGSSWPAETMLALNSVHLRQNSQVVGNVAVIRAGSGPFLSGSYEAVIADNVELRGNLRADSVSVQDGGHVFGSVASNSLTNRGTIDGAKVSPLALPLPITVPTVPNFSAGTTDVTVASRTLQTRAAGSYRNVSLRAGSGPEKTVLTLSGGVFALAALELAEHSRVECSAACELRIKGRLTVAEHAYIGPAATSGLQVSAVKVIVEGANAGNTPSSTPLAAELGAHSEFKAFVFVPNGTLWMRANSSSIGKFIAKDLDAGNDADVQDGTAVVVLPGQWRSGSRWPSEAITALNSVDFNEGVRVTGDVAVIASAAGSMLTTGYEASLGPNSLVTGKLSADSVIGRSSSRVTGALAYNNLTNNGVTAGALVTPLALPLEITTPAFPAFTAGTTAVDLASRSDRTLAPGSYGLIKLRAGVSSDATVLKLTGGVYNVADIDVADYSRIECSAACELRVKNRIAPGSRSYLGPANAALDISQVRVFVEGRNAGNGLPSATPYAAVFGQDSTLSAFVFVPNGTLHVRAGTQVRGRLAARDVLVSDSGRVDAAGLVITPAQITQQPSSISIVDGQSATFTVVAVGTEISFQWQRNGVAIPGATAGSYTLNPARVSDNGATFRVVVSNAGGSVTSNAATLTVTPAPPVITTQPASITVLEGETASFSCAASGTAPTYRWTKDGGNISGATNATYSIANVRVADAGAYRCIATNTAGNATSNPATLIVTLKAPVITVQPADITRTEGQTATLSVTATGTDLSYQWRNSSGQSLVGKTSSTLSFAPVAIGDAGQYSVLVSNSGGSVTSRTATLTVQLVAPTITQHPISQTVSEGAPVTFTCGASGNLLQYQWLHGTAVVPGATAASLTIIAVSKDHEGQYRCVVSNAGGSDTSNAALLTVRLLPPEITTQPTAVTVTEKQSASFTCAASGTSVSVRWQKGGVDAGATGETYTIASVEPEDAGNYRCVATNTGGTATSQAAPLSVNLLPPVIDSGPSSLIVTENQPATFHCAAHGSSITYQWQKGSDAVEGATSATYTIAHAKEENEGAYRCVVTNSGGTVTSEPATLSVQALPPQITNQPDAKTVNEHESVSFTCDASGSGVSYRWQKDDADIAGSSGATFTIADVLHTDAGGYRCVATNESGSATSNAATLTVKLLPPQITSQPAPLTVTEKQSASFSCAASGTSVTIRWQKGGVDISDATGETYTIASVKPEDAGNYRCVATNSGGSATSQVAALSVNLLPPVIESGPSSLTVTENQPATFECTARGSAVGYQWQKGEDAIAGATSATYTIAHAKETDEGEYRCVATNSGGTATSEPATLSVQALPPQITNQPDARTADEHSSASFTCAASGSGVTYHWQKDGTDLVDSSGATYTIADVSHTDAGGYRCVATNEGGSATSNAATLTVRLLPPQITTQPTAVTVTEKQSASFSCAASGTSVSVRWQKGGVDISGAIGETYAIASVVPDDAGNYRCVATNSGGSATSQVAVLSVNLLPPEIESGPSSLTVTENQPATFECTARGSAVGYQWQKGSDTIAGATNATYTIAHAKETDEGEYRCVATNSGGTATSEPATLSVQALPPQITDQPDAKTVDEHSSVSFTCAASGSGVSYRWQKGEADIAGASGATYAIADVVYTDAGGYRCVATNESGSVTSNAATLTVRLLPPQITAQPTAVTVTEKQSASFSCAASGTSVTVRWQKGGADISGADSQTYTIASVTPEDAGNYRCIATNTGGSATSQAVALSVLLLPPVIEGGPSSQTVTENEPATFSCTARGSSISYRWLKGEAVISGATSAVFTIAHAKETDEAEYRCEVTNSAGSAVSEPATLSVQALPPQITNQPDARTVDEGSSVSFTCAASGSGVTYDWQKDGGDIAGASGATFTIADVKHTDAGGYACVATNESGSATSDAATLSVRLLAPQIIAQPENLTVTEDAPATFRCEARGTSLSYRWQKGGVDIPDSAAPTLTIASVELEDVGSYRCIATNTGGSATSQAATLSVNLLPPRISAGPLNVRVYERQTASFQCLGEGTQISYQWQKGEIDLPGATAAELAIVGVSYMDAGEYRCKVSNSGGEAFSQPASLTVDLLPPSFPSQPASVSVTEGQPFSLSCPASGTSITLQWSKDGTPIEGAVFATYSVETAVVEQTGIYTCNATNSGGSTTSQPASVVVHAKPPVITTQPADVHVNENQPITLSVVAQGHSLSFQWMRAGSPVPSATQSSYTKAQASAADDGAVFRVVVSNSGGSVTSDSATVHVADTSGPALEVNGEAEVTVSGDTFTVSGSASDGGSGIREVTLTSDRTPGQTFGVVLDSAGAFTGDIPLSLGTNVITIVARDAQNNETRRTITITVTAPVLPQIVIQAPAAGSTVQTERVTVSGRVRSSQPASDIKLSLGSATLYPSGSGPDYTFSFEQVRLVSGPNLITVLAQTPRGNTQADLSVSYGAITPPPATPIPPVIELQPNLADVYLSADTIPVTGTVRAQRCVQSIRVSGTAVSFIGTGPIVTFSTTRSFSALGSNDVLVTASVTDCDSQTAAVGFRAHRDDGAPVIMVDGLQLAPAVNTVSHSPYRLSGSVTDLALAGVSIASQSVAAQPTGAPGQWRFVVDLELVRQLALPVVIEAWDAAGQRSSSEVVLQLDTNLTLEVLAPNERATYLVTGQAVPIEITARAIGMAAGDVVSARFDEGSESELLRAGPVANGVLNVNAAAGEHAVTLFVKSAEGSVLAQRSVRVTFKDERDLPVRVVSQEPAADSTNVEANTPIVVHFNRPIDPSKLTMSVLETVHGKLFEDQPPGADLTQLSAVNLIDVDRERESVPGVAQNLPGNRMITFYPSRDYGYGGTVFVELRYDGNDLAHSKFSVRPLPTLVHGFVATQQLIPLQGIEVSLPELGRSATSNDDGNWNFGFGESPDRRIAPGRYRAIFNPQRKKDRFGSVERFIEFTAGLAFGGTVLVPELNKAEPFRRIASLQPQAASLASGGLELDLSHASLVFPDGLAEGDVHTQFLVGSEVGHVSIDGARPDWVFGVQPGGVQVQGPVGIRMQVPKLDQSFAYVDRLPDYMLLVGLDAKSLQIAPAGVVRLDRTARTVQSVGAVRLERLDYVGVAITAADLELLKRYANGEIDLAALTAAIGAAP